MTDDDKDLIIDMLKTQGWAIYEKMNQAIIQGYRDLATQPPNTISEEMRTWYAGLAKGREEAITEIKQLIQ